MKILITSFLLLVAVFSTAQDIPTPISGNFFSRQGPRNTSPGKGLSIEYERHPNYDLNTDFMQENGKIANPVEGKQRFEAKLKIPLILRGNWKVLAGLEYSFERYNFEEIKPADNPFFNALDDTNLKRSKGTFYIFRDMFRQNYIAFRAEVSYNGTYDGIINFDKRYAIYRLAAAYGIKKNENTELALGVLFNNNFERNVVYPFVIFDHTFNDKWGIETALPVKYALRRNLSEKSLLLLKAEYWSSAYSLDIIEPNSTNGPENYLFKSSAAQFILDWQKNVFTAWTWFSLQGGYSYNFDSRFQKVGDLDTRVAAFPSNSIFVSLGFFLSPPKKAIEKARN